MKTLPRPGDTLAGGYLVQEKVTEGPVFVSYDLVREASRFRLLCLQPSLAEREDVRLRLAERVRALREIADQSQYLVQIVTAALDAAIPHIITPQPGGQTLDDVVGNGESGLPFDEAAEICDKLLVDLEVLHDAELVHGGFLPGTVTRKGCSLDPGLEGVLLHQAQLPPLEPDKPYLAPEIETGAPPSPVSDIYSVGALLYAIATGAPPTSNPLDTAPLPTGGGDVIRRATAVQPEDRYLNAGAMRQELDRVLFGETMTLSASTVKPLVTPDSMHLFPVGGEATDRYFLIGREVVRFGREKRENDLILRLLPCRNPVRDADNWNATLKVSGYHGEFHLQEDRICIWDKSSLGTWVESERVPTREPVTLQNQFFLNLARVFQLFGRTLTDEDGTVAGLVLNRLENTATHHYLLLRRGVLLGGHSEHPIQVKGAPTEEPTAEIRIEDGTWLLISRSNGQVNVDGNPLEKDTRLPLTAGQRIAAYDSEWIWGVNEPDDFLKANG